MTVRPAAARRIAIVGGNGAVGRLLANALASEGRSIEVIDFAPAAHPDLPAETGYTSADARTASAAVERAVAEADCVIVALPEQAALEAVAGVTARMRPGALLVDTLSVKSAIVSKLRQLSPPIEALSINPMFGPSLGFEGHTVLAVEVFAGELTSEMIRLLEGWGANVVRCDEQAHDEATASIQVLTHAAIASFGLALKELGDDIGFLLDAATPPFTTLTALLARVASGSPATYGEIQAGHPHAQRARDALMRGQERLDEAAAGGPQQVAELLDELRRVLGPERAALEARAQDILATARRPPTPGD